MIFFVGNDGTIIKGLPSPVYQGAANSNTVYLIAPFAENTTVTVAFKLPNGVVTAPAAMAQQGALAGVTDAQTGQTYAGWTYDLPNSITSLYGTVTAQFFFYAAQAGVITATSGTSFQVGRGVPAVLPDTPDDDVYEQILSNIAALQTDVSNGYYAARAIYAWNSAMTYGANEITYYPVGTYGALVKSLVANNTNNEPYTTGGVPNSAFWEEVLNFDGALSEAQGYAASAATSATDAYNYQLSAKGFAEAAESSANSAASSENNASGSAFSANQFKEAAESSATAAAGSATAAANSATEAQGYAQQAKDYAQKHYAVYPSFDALPVPGDSAFIYLVPAEDGEENNSYTEYLWITDLSSYESIGTVNDIDLSGYAQINGTYAGMTVGNATNAQTAQNAQQLGGVAASQYAQISGTYSGMTVGKATNADNATKATQDASGNVITVTYATKTENNAKYTKPSTGIPKSDLASAVQTSLGKADTAYQKPSSGIPESDLAQAVRNKLNAESGITDSEIISRETLPTATADSPDFVQTADGKIYRKKIIEQELAADTTKVEGVWTINTNSTPSSSVAPYFNANEEITSVSIESENGAAAWGVKWYNNQFRFLSGDGSLEGRMCYYSSSQWYSAANNTITFGSGTDGLSYSEELLTFLNAYATKHGTLQNVYSYVEIADASSVAAKYTKPSTGIPESDLASAVQTSLGKADTALQSVPLATSSAIGGVKPVAKTDDMTQSVGVDVNGALFTAPSGGTIEYMTNEEVDALFASTPSIPSFADATWEQIAQVAEAGTASNYFAVGDEKTIALSTDEQITLVILGFNHDDLSDSSGKAGITIGMKNLLATTYRMNATETNSGGWDESEMRTTTMQTLLGQLPSDLQAVIKSVDKKATSGSASTAITTSSDKLFLFSEVEIDGTTSAGYADEGEQYEYWKTVKDGTVSADRIKYLSNGSGSVFPWWLRSPSSTNSRNFRCIISGGNVSSNGANGNSGVSFGFCV